MPLHPQQPLLDFFHETMQTSELNHRRRIKPLVKPKMEAQQSEIFEFVVSTGAVDQQYVKNDSVRMFRPSCGHE